jgi:mono/diheme cytochrome c family protein
MNSHLGRSFGFVVLFGLGALFLIDAAPTVRAADSPDVLARQAHRILQKQCATCHTGKSPRGGFDLTSRESLLKGGHSGLVFDSEKPAESRLLKLVTHAEEPGMPFKKAKLPADEIEILIAWIKSGAPYSEDIEVPAEEDWWSLRPLTQQKPVPDVPPKWRTWPRNPIDQFVAAAWTSKQLGPSAEADRRTLLRRVTFDLIGLPPTPDEMAAFLANDSPLAYERVVDRLLDSPHYGERWARFWMDLAHFAETHGHDQDRPRPNAWPYRDYLIRSFNQDKPYTRFVQEQIAGDVLWPNDPDAIVAMGFLAAGPWDESSLRDIRDDTLDRQVARYLDRDDMVTTAMSTFVSSTVHCARCHEHKFDPISQAEYYRLQAVFAGVDKGERAYDPDPQVASRRTALTAFKANLPGQLQALDASLLSPAAQAEVAVWESKLKSSVTPWIVLKPDSIQSEQGTTLTQQPDGSVLASGVRPEKDVYSLATNLSLSQLTFIRLEVLTDDSLPLKGPGRQDNGNLHLNEIVVTVAPRNKPAESKPVKLINPRADFNQQDWGIEKAIDGNPGTAWGIHPQVSLGHVAVFEVADPNSVSGNVVLTVRLEQTHGRGHLIGKPRVSVTDIVSSQPVKLGVEVLPGTITDALKVERGNRTDRQRAELAAFYLTQRTEEQLSALPPIQYIYAASSDFKPDGGFAPAKSPRVINVLKRGDIRSPGVEVAPGGMACVPDLSPEFALSDVTKEGSRRVALAKWLTDSKNGLAWRSIVNRVWQRRFGRGIVDTPNDFGRMGSLPSHPELLDWLAMTFRDRDAGNPAGQAGSIKKLDRLLVTSATYRQVSRHQPDFAERDADNRYLWRMPRMRLDAEEVRDAVLQISGKLDRTFGGPSVKQFIQTPAIHVTPGVDYLNFNVDSPENYRRSVYRFLFRTLPDPFMETLDCADSSQLTPVRNTSVTALQSLATMNNKLMVRQSEHLAERLTKTAPQLPDQITILYDLVLNRTPDVEERKLLQDYAQTHGLANACRMLLNSNEFLFLD